MNNETFWPCTFDELNVGDSDPERRIQPQDIASYAYPPGRRDRYTESGWKKAKALRIAELDVRDFGAIPE